jgi:hypothetical protein
LAHTENPPKLAHSEKKPHKLAHTENAPSILPLYSRQP